MEDERIKSDPLWRFAKEVYAAEAVARECLAAQSGHGADVCLLLSAAFAGSRHRIVTEQAARAWNDSVSSWRDSVILPLRAARDALKTSIDDPARAALRKNILAAELQAERLQLSMLFHEYESARLTAQPGVSRANCVTQSLQVAMALFTSETVPMPGLVAAALAHRN
jgi:uncharacterized protein (TIGR02444 family)